MRTDGGGLYLEPLFYDVVNTPGTDREVAALERVARRFGTLRSASERPATERSAPGRSAIVWLEPACGTGRYLRALLRRGYTVRGYDVQQEMLAYAAGRLSRLATVKSGARQALACSFALTAAAFTTPAASLRRLGPADVAFCPVSSLRHLPSDQDVLAHLEQITALLAPGGVYLVGLDLHHPGCNIDEDVWIGRRGRLRVTQVVQYLPPSPGSRLERVIVEMVASRPRGDEHHSFAYDLRTYTERQWISLIEQSALRRLAVCDAHGWAVRDANEQNVTTADVDARAARLPYRIEVLARR